MSNYKDFSPHVVSESGTYTVTITNISGTDNIVTGGTTVAGWTKRGQLLHINGRVDVVASSNTNNAFINLPFSRADVGLEDSVLYGWTGGGLEGWFKQTSDSNLMIKIQNNNQGSIHLNELNGVFRFSLNYLTIY